jgi:hypothetical protein
MLSPYRASPLTLLGSIAHLVLRWGCQALRVLHQVENEDSRLCTKHIYNTLVTQVLLQLSSSEATNLKILRPLLTSFHPLLQGPQIPRAKPTLKRLRISRQTCRNSIAFQCIQNRLIFLVLRRINMERTYQPDECSIQLPIGQMGPRAHARACPICIMRCSGAFGVLEIALYGEDLGFFEVNWVIVRRPCIL